MKTEKKKKYERGAERKKKKNRVSTLKKAL